MRAGAVRVGALWRDTGRKSLHRMAPTKDAMRGALWPAKYATKDAKKRGLGALWIGITVPTTYIPSNVHSTPKGCYPTRARAATDDRVKIGELSTVGNSSRPRHGRPWLALYGPNGSDRHGDNKSKCLSNLLRLLDLQTLPTALPTGWLL